MFLDFSSRVNLPWRWPWLVRNPIREITLTTNTTHCPKGRFTLAVFTASVNSAPVFTARVGDISTNQKIHLITAALRITWTQRHLECLLSKYYFLFVYFSFIVRTLYCKTFTDTSISVTKSAVSNVFNRHSLHRYIARLDSQWSCFSSYICCVLRFADRQTLFCYSCRLICFLDNSSLTDWMYPTRQTDQPDTVRFQLHSISEFQDRILFRYLRHQKSSIFVVSDCQLD